MSVISVLMIGLGLAMDALAVSITIGINSNKKSKIKMAFKAGLFFGVFQAIMPFIGWAVGRNFTKYIEMMDHWIAFILLAIIGGKMIYEALKGEESEEEKIYSNKTLLILAIATSIDALAVGISFAFLNVNILSSILIIGVVTAILSFIAVYIGEKLGEMFKKLPKMPKMLLKEQSKALKIWLKRTINSSKIN